MKYHTLFFLELGKMSQNLSSVAVVIGTLRVNIFSMSFLCKCFVLYIWLWYFSAQFLLLRIYLATYVNHCVHLI